MNKFDIDKWNEIKKTEFLRKGGPSWIYDFSETFRKLQEKQKYDEVWEKIKKKNNW